MKLKKSFFNKTIFWKNVTLFWPIWGFYAACVLLFQPGLLWLLEYNIRDYSVYTYSYGDHLANFVGVLNTKGHTVGVAFAAVFIGMALYHYMYNTKSANVIHALPVDRTQLFGTNVISSILFLAVPQFVSAILTTIIALCFGIHEIQYVLYWFLMMVGIDIAALSFVTFCAMLTGHIIMLPILVLIVNYFVFWVYYLVEVVAVSFGYGIDSIGSGILSLIEYFSPLHAIVSYVDIRSIRNGAPDYECIGMEVEGVSVLFAYILVAFVLYALGYLIYKKRQIECAGEVLSVNWIKPIFRFLIGASGGVFGAMLLREIFYSIGLPCGVGNYVLMMLILGVFAYFIADMVVKKSFHVFHKKNWMRCGVFAVTLLAGFAGIYIYSNSLEYYLPKAGEIEKASINLGYEVVLEGEDAEAILDIHNDILEQKALCEKAEDSGNRNYEYVNITYTLKNGDYFLRSYRVPNDYEELYPIFDKIYLLEDDSENYLRYIFCKNYEQIDTFNYGWVELQVKKQSVREDEYGDYTYENIDITPEQSEKLYAAIIADVRNLRTYNLYGYRYTDEELVDKYAEASLMIEFKNPNADSEKTEDVIYVDENSAYVSSIHSTRVETVTVDTTNWLSTYVVFGPDCENIINTLIELEIIESADDLW